MQVLSQGSSGAARKLWSLRWVVSYPQKKEGPGKVFEVAKKECKLHDNDYSILKCQIYGPRTSKKL